MRLIIVFLVLPTILFGQNLPSVAAQEGHFSHSTTLNILKNEIQGASSIELKDVQELEITSEHVSAQSNIQHSYVTQRINGYQIDGVVSSIHLYPNQKVLAVNDNFLRDIHAKVKTSISDLTAIQAIRSACQALNYNQVGLFEVIESSATIEQKQLISKGLVSKSDIPAKLVYHVGKDDEMRLAWDISIQETSGINWWSLKVDAQTGAILDKKNWILTCNFGSHPKTEHNCADHEPKVTNANNNSWLDLSPTKINSGVGAYRVFAFPYQHPGDGPRTLVMDPDSAAASPFGWHDTNGAAGPEYTTTRGNNVHAFEDGNNPGYSPNGGATLNFDFPLDLSLNPDLYEDAAVTNLFYCVNVAHDVLVYYGFDEASGNFQETNYSGVAVGGDYVEARSQISAFCNATFGTPPEGASPTMSNYICNNNGSDRDGSYTNNVILHEFAHGLSNRLTGGAANTSCLSNQEQMGEGWSDFLSLIMTIKPGDTGKDARPLGDWLFDDPVGIRPHPYSTDLLVNPHTYDDIIIEVAPHGLGSVWCNMLWEMTWGLIAQHGFDPNIYSGSGGNNIALQLVVEGLKLQPCSPGFVDGRDAILAADQALYGGANQCIIWQAFAKRGLGKCSDQGLSSSKADGTEGFDVPASCGGSGCDITVQGPVVIDVTWPMGIDSTFDILVGGNATWFANSTVPWIALDSTTGSGDATISFDIAENFTFTRRTGLIEITCDSTCFVRITINQEAKPCTQFYTNIPYFTGFESGLLDSFWCIQSSEIDGRIQVTDQNGPNNGNYHLTLDTDGNGYNLNEATLGLKLGGITGGVNLIFSWKEFGDEDDPEDGVFFSDDAGQNYVKVHDLVGTSQSYTQIPLSLSALAASNGLTLTDSFVVKFQQYDNFNIPTDGFAFDDVAVILPNCTVGAPCNDGDTCTTNDVYDTFCLCVGTLFDTDNDGVCDVFDICPGGDDNLDLDADGIPDFCDSIATCNNCAVLINVFPHTEDFEPDVKEICQFPGDDFEWTVFSGSTSSTNTGPTAAYEGQNYFYIETSGSNNPDKLAAFQSGCYDLSAAGTAFIEFWYHMYGATIGTLVLEVSPAGGGNWAPVWTLSGDQGNQWNYINIDISSFVGGSMSYRFTANSTSSFTGDIALDKITVNVGVTSCTPGATCDDNNACTVNDVYNNFCVCVGTFLDADNDGVCDTNDVCPGHDDNLDFDGDGIPDGCDNTVCNDCSVVISSFPHAEDFEPDVKEICQYDGDDFDWTVQSGSTTSTNTGPTMAYQGMNYFYTETSTPNHPDKVAAFQSGCYDLSALGTAHIDFHYHMYGATMGSIKLDVSIDTGSTWITVWNVSGDQGNQWNYQFIDLSSYTGNILTYRVIANTTTSYTSDFALDSITVDYTPLCTPGTVCNDADSCTINDIYDSFCNCVGTFQDTDMDTVCDAQDICPGHDDTIDDDGDGIPNGCDSVMTSIVDIERVVSLKAFPNPFSYHIDIELSGLNNGFAEGVLEVTDVVGRTIYEQQIEWTNRFEMRLPLGDIASGVYYIQYKDDQNRAIQKILKVRN